MDGVALGARFSIATNRLQYCGPSDAEPALYGSILADRGTEEARSKLRGFEALYPYLEMIGRHHDRDPLDREVVEAYWIGNALLEGFSRTEFVGLLDSFARRGMPRSIARRLQDHWPEGAVPHHAFHVSYVGVGTVTGHVETTVANIERCRPAWATVRERNATHLTLDRPRATLRQGRLEVGSPARESVTYDPKVVPDAAPGRSVVLHWDWPALVLSDAQRDALASATARSFEAANAAWPSLRVLGDDGAATR